MRRALTAMVAWCIGWMAPLARAQITYEMKDTASAIPKESAMWEWIYGAVFVFACLAVAFKGAKRSNLE